MWEASLLGNQWVMAAQALGRRPMRRALSQQDGLAEGIPDIPPAAGKWQVLGPEAFFVWWHGSVP